MQFPGDDPPCYHGSLRHSRCLRLAARACSCIANGVELKTAKLTHQTLAECPCTGNLHEWHSGRNYVQKISVGQVIVSIQRQIADGIASLQPARRRQDRVTALMAAHNANTQELTKWRHEKIRAVCGDFQG